MNERARELWLRLLFYLVVAVVLTWPLVLHPASLVVGGDRTDVWNTLWGLWFVHQNGPFPVHTTLLDHPTGGWLAVADPLNAVLAYPLTGRFGPAVAYAMLVIGHLTFAGFAADRLGSLCGGRGWVAGIGYQLAPICVSYLQNGTSESVATGWLPLACLAVIRAVERGGWKRSLWAGLALATCAIASWYAGVGAWLFAGAVLLVGWAKVPFRARLGRLALGMGLALALTLPVAWRIRQVALEPDGLVEIKTPEDLSRIRRTLGAADPRIFVVPGDFSSPDFAHLEGNPTDYVHTAYLGYGLMLAALVAGSRRRDGRNAAWWTAVVAGIILAMGPVVVWDGKPLAFTARHLALPLPYLALEKLPGFSALSLLYRLATVAALGLAVLADRLPRARGSTVAVALAVVAEFRLVSPVAGLPELTDIPRVPALRIIANKADGKGAVLNLPPTASRDFLYEQILHGQPLVGSLNTGINLAGLKVLAAARALRKDRITQDDFIRVARDNQVRWVVMHKDVLMERSTLVAANAIRRMQPKVAEDDTVRVYQLY